MNPVSARSAMTRWYSPRRMAATAFRVVTSKIFGEYSDARDAQAASRPLDMAEIDPCQDYSEHTGDFWFDYVADTGDGWEATHAVARLLAARRITVDGSDLPRGRLLVLGGDQVYPTASRDAYRKHLVAPFASALPEAGKEPAPHLYAIPGNHDWYDNLASFLGLFCARRPQRTSPTPRPGRRIGAWETRQIRSYFVLKLPSRWWLWGVDLQLNGYIDQAQLDFFRHAAAEWMDPGDRVILCTPQPDWIYASDDAGAFRNLGFIEYIIAKRGCDLALVLAGDMHNYNRYVADAGTSGGRHYVTAGGGGAFLHPTHHLPERIEFAEPGSSSGTVRRFTLAGKRFPEAAASRKLAWGNWKFPFLNIEFAGALAGIYGFVAWTLDAASRAGGTGGLDLHLGEPGFAAALANGAGLLGRAPLAVLVLLALCAGYVAFADERLGTARRLLAGAAHFLAQAVTAGLLGTALVQALHGAFGATGAWGSAAAILAIGCIGGAVAASAMGLYLLVMLNGFGFHWNEAFSSLRLRDFKNLLRLRIDAQGGLHVHALGIRRVPRGPAPDLPQVHPIEILSIPPAPTLRPGWTAHAEPAGTPK